MIDEEKFDVPQQPQETMLDEPTPDDHQEIPSEESEEVLLDEHEPEES